MLPRGCPSRTRVVRVPVRDVVLRADRSGGPGRAAGQKLRGNCRRAKRLARTLYDAPVIRSFADKATERLSRRESVPAVDPRIRRTALRKLRLLDSASSLEELRVPPPGIGLSVLRAIDLVSTASGSMTGGGSVSDEVTPDRRRLRSLTTTDKIAPIHPGEILMEDFIKGFGVTQSKVADAIGVPSRRINEIVHGKRRITADTAARLGRYFGTSARFWLTLQDAYDLDVLEDSIGEALDAIEPLESVV